MRTLSHPFRFPRQVPIWIGVFVAATAIGLSVLALNGKLNRESAGKPNDALSAVTTTETATPASSYKLQVVCFTRGDDIYLMDVSSGRVKKILKGDEPDVSPGGDQIAFVQGEKGALKTVDVKSGTIKEFASLQTVMANGPQWSPDGSKIAFAFMKDYTWRIGLLNVATEQWLDVTASYPTGENYFLSSWTTKGQSLVIQDLERAYEVDLNGRELQRVDVRKLLKHESLSSSSRLSLSGDKQSLLFNTAADPEHNTAIYKLDLKTSVLERITPETIDGSEPHWLPTEKEILFSQLTDNKPPYEYSIARLSLEKDKAPEILVRDASNISYAPR